MGRTSDARERLIRSAGELWHAGSYSEVGVNEICEHAGVRKGSFYHFFPTKRDLALAVIDDFWSRQGAALLACASAPDIPPLERITGLVELQVEMLTPALERNGHVCGCPFGNLASEMSTQDPVLRERLARLFDGSLEFFERALSDAIASGDLPPIDVHETARAMLAYMQGLHLLAKTQNDLGVLRGLGPAILRLAHAAPVARRPRRRVVA